MKRDQFLYYRNVGRIFVKREEQLKWQKKTLTREYKVQVIVESRKGHISTRPEIKEKEDEVLY